MGPIGARIEGPDTELDSRSRNDRHDNNLGEHWYVGIQLQPPKLRLLEHLSGNE